MKLPGFIAPTALKLSRQFFSQFGYELTDLKPYNQDIKDVEYYRPLFCPWLTPEWKDRLRIGDARSLLTPQAKYVFYCLSFEAVGRCSGDLAECGVYKGGTTKILAESVPDRPIYAFDTFEGMPDTDPIKDRHKPGDFSDTSLASVREYLARNKNVTCIPGLVPESLKAVEDRTFAFVHIDLDIYAPIKSACEFFYPRLQSGGVFLFDDYAFPSCPGARAAVDEFFADKPESRMVYMTGQCSVQKRSVQKL